jgi:Putative zinc-finger
VRELFSAAVDGGLSVDEQARLDAHVAGCADCRRELERFERTVSLLREAEPVRAPAGFVDRVLAAARPEPWWKRIGRRLVSPWPMRIPQAAAVTAVAIVAVYLYRGTPEQTTILREAVPPALEQPAGERSQQATDRSSPARVQPTPESGAMSRPLSPGVSTETAEPAAKERRAQPAPPRAVEPRADVAPAPPPSAPASPPVASAPHEQRSEQGVDARKAPEPAATAPGRDRSAVGLGRAAADDEARTKRAESPRLAAKARNAPSPQLEGRLQGVDRAEGRTRVTELVVGLGGSIASEQTLADGLLIEAVVPRARYRDLLRGFAQLGQWSPVSDLPMTGDPVRIVIRLD